MVIRMSRTATVDVGDYLALTLNGTAPRVNSLDFPGIRFAQGNVSVMAPENSLPPDIRVNVQPGEKGKDVHVCVLVFVCKRKREKGRERERERERDSERERHTD